MPGNDGRLTPQEKQRVIDWLHRKGTTTQQCPVCGTNAWTVGDHLLNGMVHHGGGNVILGGASYPMAFVVCNNCAYTRHFMAVPMGVLDPKAGGNG